MNQNPLLLLGTRAICQDPPKDKELDQEFSVEANYRVKMRGVRSFMGWHQIPDFDSSLSSLEDNPFAGSRAQPTGKVFIKMTGCAESSRN